MCVCFPALSDNPSVESTPTLCEMPVETASLTISLKRSGLVPQ